MSRPQPNIGIPLALFQLFRSQMDSKNIYIAANHMRQKVVWINNSDNEWSYIGEGEDFMEKEAQAFIDTFFSDDELYIAIDRHRSHSTAKRNSLNEFRNDLAGQNVLFCNYTFTKIIEFNPIGVFRYGSVEI